MRLVLFTSVCLLLAEVAWTDHCPARCFCNKALTSVNCEGKQFMTPPKDIPKSVEKLYLQHNEIADLEQGSFSELPQLQELYLQNNKLSVIKPMAFSWSRFPSLKLIRLDNNHISTLEMNAFFNLTTLNITYLTNNYISSINPQAFYGCLRLTFLQLAQNDLMSIPALQSLPGLQQLSLQGNSITNASFPASYEESTALATIGLSANKIDNLTSETFMSLKNSSVRKLELSRNKITDISSGAFLPLTKLVSLVISLNPLTATKLHIGLQGLRSSAFRSLNIARLDLGGRLPSSTFALLNGTGLKQLLMSNNKINQLPSRAFATLKNLEQIDLHSCAIQKVDNDTFAGLLSLTNLNLADNIIEKVPINLPSTLSLLYLNGNKIAALGENAFVNLASLKNLYLGGNKISEVNRFAFRGLVSLQKLHLVANSINSLAAELFTPFGMLVSLELNKNNLKTIQNSPDIFSYMTSLQYLSLADNGCSSMPLESFKHLQSLKYLILDGNNLGRLIGSDRSGTMFAGLNKLQRLTLSNNFLVDIPGQLFKDLSSLQTLNMKNNRISGWDNVLFKHTTAMKNLDLSYNTISLVNSSSLEDLSSNNNFQMLNLSNNPFACTCDLRWFRDWVNQTRVTVANVEKYICNSPIEWKGRHFLSFDRTKINCIWFNLYFVTGVSIASALVVLIICVVMYKKRWWILYKCYRLNSWCCASRNTKEGYQAINGVNGDGWTFDAYISYAEDDYRWVVNHLLPDIDSGELDRPFNGQFRLFFSDRDSVPGSSVISSISDNMEISKKVIIVLTKKYLSNAQHKFEIDLAVQLKFEGIINDIIVVNVEGVPFMRIPQSLQRKVSREEFLMWENEENARNVFKDQLKRELSKVVKATEVVV